MTIFFTFTYLAASEYVSSKKSKGEVLLFQRGHRSSGSIPGDIEKPAQLSKSDIGILRDLPQKINGTLHKQTSIFQWRNICYDIKIKKAERRILDHVDGWVKPGTLTALMVS
jgi:ATP-binding cassette, subfamily G (WHITE), member 2, PDR